MILAMHALVSVLQRFIQLLPDTCRVTNISNIIKIDNTVSSTDNTLQHTSEDGYFVDGNFLKHKLSPCYFWFSNYPHCIMHIYSVCIFTFLFQWCVVLEPSRCVPAERLLQLVRSGMLRRSWYAAWAGSSACSADGSERLVQRPMELTVG